MKKATKLKLVRIATIAAVCLSAVGVIMYCGRGANTHAASQFTHGLKVIGEAFGGGMYRGATVVAGAGAVASEVMDSAANYIIPDDVVAQAVTPPPTTPVSDEPRFSDYANMQDFLAAYRQWEMRNAGPEDDIVAQYDAWEAAQRARRDQRPSHPMWDKANTASAPMIAAALSSISPLGYLSDDELDEAI